MYSKKFAERNNCDIVVHYYKIINGTKVYFHDLMNHNYYESTFKYLDYVNIIGFKIL